MQDRAKLIYSSSIIKSIWMRNVKLNQMIITIAFFLTKTLINIKKKLFYGKNKTNYYKKCKIIFSRKNTQSNKNWREI